MITLHACAACGHAVFPARLLCPSCGGAAWTDLPCERGTIQAITTVASAPIAEIRTPHAVRLIARLRHASPPGTTVALQKEDGALWAIDT